MTSTEAKEFLGIKEKDSIQKDGIRYLLEIAESNLQAGTYAPSDREKLEKETAAYKALLND